MRADLEKEKLDGLCNQASRELFLTWYMFGGLQRGFSLDEVLNAPAWLLQDFAFFISYTGKERERQKREKRQKTAILKRQAARRKGRQ